MLDPITALGIAGNVVQFVDFGLKATSKAREIHRSGSGVLEENIDIEILTADISTVTTKLSTLGTQISGHNGLDDICKRCTTAANHLLAALNDLKIQGQKSKIKSVRKALKHQWGKRNVDEMRSKLEGFRDEIQFHVLVDLKCNIDFESTRNLERFSDLDENVKAFFDVLSNHHNVMMQIISAEGANTTARQKQLSGAIMAGQKDTQKRIVNAVEESSEIFLDALSHSHNSMQVVVHSEITESSRQMEQVIKGIDTRQANALAGVVKTLESLEHDCHIERNTSREEQKAIRWELEQTKQTLEEIKREITKSGDEMRELVAALRIERNGHQRKKIIERGHAITVALRALAIVKEALKKLIASLRARMNMILAVSYIFGDKHRHRTRSKSVQPLSAVKSMLDAVVNVPSDCVQPSQFQRMVYLEEAERNSARFAERFGPIADTNWAARHFLDDRTIAKELDIDDESRLLIRTETHLILSILDSQQLLTEQERDVFSRIRPMIIISTVLANFLGLENAAGVVDKVFYNYSESFVEIHEANIMATILPDWRHEQRQAQLATIAIRYRPQTVFTTTARARLRQVTACAAVGKIAGFEDTASSCLDTRLRKWNTKRPPIDGELVFEICTFLACFLESATGSHSFEIKNEESRSRGAVIIALSEYLTKSCFPFSPPEIYAGAGGLRARVAWATSTKSNLMASVLELPRSRDCGPEMLTSSDGLEMQRLRTMTD